MDNQPSNDQDEWEIIVPPLPREEAERKFLHWTREREAQGLPLRPDQIRRDQIFAGPGQGCLVRFRVLKKA